MNTSDFASNLSPNHQDLDTHRAEIDAIDDGIFILLEKRLHAAKKISKIKKETGKEIKDPQREVQLFQRLKEKFKNTEYDDEKLLEIWGKIIELSRDVQAGR